MHLLSLDWRFVSVAPLLLLIRMPWYHGHHALLLGISRHRLRLVDLHSIGFRHEVSAELA